MSGLRALYEQDFRAWVLANAELLRQGRLAEIDAKHPSDVIPTR